jgi:hypothetical protein
MANKVMALPKELTGRAVEILKTHANFAMPSLFISNSAITFTVVNGYADVVLRLVK